MSHFAVLVQLPHCQKLEKLLEKALAPYCEEMEVDPYERPCDCVEIAVMRAVSEEARKKYRDIDELRAEFSKTPEYEEIMKRSHGVPAADELTAAWRKFARIDERLAFEKSVREEAKAKSKPDADCDECKGTGKVKSTYNPDSKWDWYEIGGRYTGFFGEDKDGIPKDVITGKEGRDFLKSHAPYAMITKDGKWHQRGKMGWWGMSSDEMSKEDWAKKVNSLAASFADDDVLVAVDCHI